MDTPASSHRLSIPDWGDADRPREKYVAKGASALSDAELIAILLRSGTATSSAVDLAKELLHTCDNRLNTLSETSYETLLNLKGIGPAKATTLLAAFEIGRRMRSESIEKKRKIETSRDVVEIMQDKIAHLRHEEFWCIYLNTVNDILGIEQIGKGGFTNTAVDVRIVLQRAIILESTALIVAHNHPSGSVTPSKPDHTLTQALHQAATTLNIRLLDHVILHKDTYFSFTEEGFL